MGADRLDWIFDGIVAVTHRIDLATGFEPYIHALCRAGDWEEIERTTPERLHPERDDTEQLVITWRVRPHATRRKHG